MMQTLMHPYGAGRSQQAPHVSGFDGLVITSDSRLPAVTVSPLEDDYKAQAQSIVKHMNRLGGDLTRTPIASLADLAEHIGDLTDNLA